MKRETELDPDQLGSEKEEDLDPNQKEEITIEEEKITIEEEKRIEKSLIKKIFQITKSNPVFTQHSLVKSLNFLIVILRKTQMT